MATLGLRVAILFNLSNLYRAYHDFFKSKYINRVAILSSSGML